MTNLPPTLLFGQHSDPGPRDANQDTVLSTELPDGRRLVAVADGMGGLADGERAGKTALAALYRSLSSGADLVRAVQEANAAVRRESKGNSTTGTTLVAAVLEGHRAEIVNVGDSRAYHLDPLGLLQITRDHTMGEEAARSGEFIGGDLPPNRWASALARFVGAEETVQAEVFAPLPLQKGDWLLLCSDGLHRVLGDRDMEARLKESKNPKQAAVTLVEAALARHAEDNVSVALVYLPEGGDQSGLTSRAGDGDMLPVTTNAADAGPGDASVWNPGTIFVRSPRNGAGRKPLLLASFIAVGIIALLVGAFLALDRVMSN